MGRFVDVNYSDNCCKCGAGLSGFQSKDYATPINGVIDPSMIDSFYTFCTSCGEWHDYEIERVCVVKSINVTSHKSIGK